MSDILVRDLDKKLILRLKMVAKQHGRSFQGEIKAILTEAASFITKEAIDISNQWHKRLSGRNLSDSATLIREDRKR